MPILCNVQKGQHNKHCWVITFINIIQELLQLINLFVISQFHIFTDMVQQSKYFSYRFINDHPNQLKGFLSTAISHTDLYGWMEGEALKRTFSLLKLAINLSWLPRHCMAAHARFSHQTISFVGFCRLYKIFVGFSGIIT